MTEPSKIGTVTIRQLLTARDALRRLAEMPVDVRAAYRLSRLIGAVDRELQTFQEQRNRLLREWGTPREPTAEERASGTIGQLVTLAPARLDEFSKACEAMADEQATIDLQPFDLAQIGATPVSAIDLHACGSLVLCSEG